jgi:RNA polymerase sigma-70 factor (ECF subfamily)
MKTELQKEYALLISEHQGILYKIGRSYTGQQDDFDDLYQEMMIQLWKSYGRFNGESKVSTWVYRVCLNTALNYNKSKRTYSSRFIEDERIEDFKDESDIEKELLEKEKAKILYESINELKRVDRAVILLALDGNSYSEIADILGITVSNVGAKLSRAKSKLETIMKSKNYGL